MAQGLFAGHTLPVGEPEELAELEEELPELEEELDAESPPPHP